MSRSNTGSRINRWRIALIGSLLDRRIVAAEPIEVGFRGPSYPFGAGGNSRPTGEQPESKLRRAIHYKKSLADDGRFPRGSGVPFIKSATDTKINDPTSTKQNLNSTTGVVVLASDEVTNSYVHNVLDCGSRNLSSRLWSVVTERSDEAATFTDASGIGERTKKEKIRDRNDTMLARGEEGDMQLSKIRVRIKIWRVALLGSLLIAGIVAAEPIEVGFRGSFYPPDTGGNSRPTAEKPESKLWFNDNFWWGILWSTAGNAYHIHRLDLVTQQWVDTGTVVDNRSASRADVGWDGQHLYVVSHVFAEEGGPAPAGERGELYRFSYNSARRRPYSLDPGYPVEVTGSTSETLVLEKDATLQLWVTWVENGKVMVNHSLNGDDRTWAQPFVLPAAGADSLDEDDISSIIALNGRIGVMWSNQKSPIRMHFAVHQDGQDPFSWQSDAVFTPSGDDHINLKAVQSDGDGNVFAAIKTDKDSKLIILLVCKKGLSACAKKSDWNHFEVYRSKVFDPTRPMLLIDAEKRELYVFAVIEDDSVIDDQRAIYYKKTPIDDISFSADIGVPFIKSATDIDINDPTSTKQNLNSTSGLVVLASDEVSFHYFHNFLALN